MSIKYPRNIFLLIIAISCLQVLLNPVRLLGVFNTAPIVLFFIYTIGAFAFIIFISKVFRLLWIEIVLISLVLLNLIFAVVIGNDFFSIFTNLIRPLFFFSIIKIFSLVDINDLKFTFPSTASANWLFFSYSVGVIIVAFLYFTVGGIRASSSGIALAIPLLYYFIHGRHFKTFICIVLFLFGGKFGPLAGVVCAFVFMYFFSLRKFLIAGTLCGISVLVLVFISNYQYVDFSTIPVFAKFNLSTLTEQGWELDIIDRYVVGGRLSEAYSALAGIGTLGGDLGYWLFGGGLGYSYAWQDFSGNIIIEQNKGVHFTPLAVFCVYGFPFFLFLFGYLMNYFIKAVIILQSFKKQEPNIVIWAAFFIASIVNMFTAYSLFTNVFLAVSIGLLQCHEKNKNTGFAKAI